MIPILGIKTLSEGSTSITRPSQDRIEVVTRSLQIEGVVDCAGDQQCVETGLDGAPLRIDEDLRLAIDTTAMTVAGNATGQVYGTGTQIAFDAPITGSAACVSATANPCQALQLNLSWQLGDGGPYVEYDWVLFADENFARE